MTSYRGLLNKIEAFCSAHFQVKKYAGEFKEQMPNFSTEDERFPIVYVVPTSDLSDLNTNQFSLDIYCVDIIQKDRANINTIISDCNLILNDLYLYFLDGNDLTIDVIGASAGTPINNFDLDYSAGWVKNITFEVQSYNVCAIPMNPINPNPPLVCEPVIVQNSDLSYTQTVLSGNTLDLPDVEIRVVDQFDNVLSDAMYPSVQDETVSVFIAPCEDVTYSITDTQSNVLDSGNIPSGGSLNKVIQDATVENSDASYTASILAEGSLLLPDINITIQNTNGQTVNTTSSPSVQDVILGAPDGHVHIKKANDGSIINQAVASGETVIYSVADSTINVNNSAGTTLNTTTVHATENANITLSDITFTDSNGSVSSVPVGVNITATACVPTVPVGATLMKTGQTTSYRTGDDGDLEAGRATNFLTLAVNNPFGNTNRFTDTLGGQTYSNNIIIDWSTYQGNKVLGWYRVSNGSYVTWDTAIDGALSLSVGLFTSGWRLPNLMEFTSIGNYELSSLYNYAPFNFVGFSFWTSTTYKASTTVAYTATSSWINLSTKAQLSGQYIPCRTFTVTGTTLS